MTYFITGATSSIGRVLVKKIAGQGLSQRLLVRKNSLLDGLNLPGVEFVYGDVTDPQTVQAGMMGCEQVIHLAAVVGHKVSEETWWQVSREGSRTVLQTAFDLGVKSMVQVSSISTLGITKPGEIADETRPILTDNYFSLYQKTKHAADLIAQDYAGRGLPVKIVYPCFGYGNSFASSHPSLQETTLLRMAPGKPVVIFGDGRNRLTLSYYEDTVQGIQLALEKGRPGEGYILGGEAITFPQLWDVIATLLGKRKPGTYVSTGVLQAVNQLYTLLRGAPLFPSDFFEMVSYNWCFSSAKAIKELGWHPTPFEEGIRATWQAFQQSAKAIK